MHVPDNSAQSPKRHVTEIIEISSGAVTRRWLAICMIPVAAASTAIGYGYQQRMRAKAMAAQAEELRSRVNQMDSQIKMLNSKLNEMSAAQRPTPAQPSTDQLPLGSSSVDSPSLDSPTAASRIPAHIRAKLARTSTVKSTETENSSPQSSQSSQSLHSLEALVDAQQKQLATMQDEMAKTRSDLQGNIDSTRDVLSGSIAKTHDELVTLEQRGDRNYFEFDITKSKDFQRFGPVMLSLRKADTKHESYDLNLIVDDAQLAKKRVDLYEPIWLHAGNDAQALQVVVNGIGKDRVHGYVSAPRYGETRQAYAAARANTSPKAGQSAGVMSEVNQPNPSAPREKSRILRKLLTLWN